MKKEPEGKQEEKAEETTAVAKKAPLSMAEQRKANEQYFKDPMAMVRAAQAVAAKSQWGSNLTLSEVAGFEGISQANGVSLTNGTACVLGGKLYITLEGRLKKAHESNLFGGFTTDRAMTSDERDFYEIKKGESAWITTVIRFLSVFGTVKSLEFTDFGRASATEKNPVAKSNPVEMAMKRARARALKLAFPCGLGSTEEVIEGHVVKMEIEGAKGLPIYTAEETVKREAERDRSQEAARKRHKEMLEEDERQAKEDGKETLDAAAAFNLGGPTCKTDPHGVSGDMIDAAQEAQERKNDAALDESPEDRDERLEAERQAAYEKSEEKKYNEAQAKKTQ